MKKIRKGTYKFKVGEIVLLKNGMRLRVVMRYKIKVEGITYNSYLVFRPHEITTHKREEELTKVNPNEG